MSDDYIMLNWKPETEADRTKNDLAVCEIAGRFAERVGLEKLGETYEDSGLRYLVRMELLIFMNTRDKVILITNLETLARG